MVDAFRQLSRSVDVRAQDAYPTSCTRAKNRRQAIIVDDLDSRHYLPLVALGYFAANPGLERFSSQLAWRN